MALETAPESTVNISPKLSQWLTQSTDKLFSVIPQPKPTQTSISRCKLVGHRGCKDLSGVAENTFEAFDLALASGMHGIEIDLRWTADRCLVVAHDPDLNRVHGVNKNIADLSFKELRKACPAVPTFMELIERYQGKLQFYIELKKDGWEDISTQQSQLIAELASLTPCEDYYVMSFDLDLLKALKQIPSACKVAIMHSNPSDIKRRVAAGEFATVGGHYLLLTRSFRKYCQQHKVMLGVGFPASRNSLWRELNRGAVFAFVDDPTKVKTWL